MSGPTLQKRSGPSAVFLIGLFLTLLAVLGHRLLPQRHLELSAAQPGADYALTQYGSGPPAQVDWIDERHFHYRCRIPKEGVGRSCVFNYQLSTTEHGVDLSRFQKLTLAIHYSGQAQYVRIGIRNFDPRFSTLADPNSPKYNTVGLHPKDLDKPVTLYLDEFHVPEWWITERDMPREFAHPDISNATSFSVDLFGNLPGSEHDIEVDKIEFSGDWISAERWYLIILCLWMVLGSAYGVSQWVLMLRQNRELRREKEKYQSLSTQDALTKVLNRHGIQQFIDSLQANRTSAAVVFIDLDHFKKVNDERGHHGGDRVLQTMGDILRAHTRASDGLGRWGGEEFVLVCPGMSLSKAADLAEKLRHRIKETNFLPDQPLPVTASFGVAVSQPDQEFDDALRQADQALYLAKSRGRDCVVAAAEDQLHKVTGVRRGALALITGRFKLHR